MKRNPTRALAIAAGLVIVALTAAAFWLSYAHLAEVALGHGLGGAPVRAWAWPACLDLFIMAGELMWLRAAIARHVDPWAIALTVVGSGGSIALNVAGVGSHADPLNYVVAAVPPTAALLAFGALMRQIHQALAGHTEPNPVDVIHEVPAAEVTATPSPATLGQTPTVVDLHGADDHAGVTETVTAAEPVEVVIPPVIEVPDVSPLWHDWTPRKSTAAVPAETARQMVTEPIVRTPAELRREARRLNREAVTSTRRPVTIRTLQDELGLSRRDATELRREIVGGRS
ncbi:DUF2637 domain-containing protein [Streptomyces sp. NBC_00582]|uniref:DUF2637 domain-containing protein n=1 Tax=Streptomyces sp. NBC_00582 TaxID=2975783 RepID=UPI002E81912D|nr:DUF2637 domain-containing protein [Streptomyces sp. NBC_00582]WUB60449.1 DUF2637 domain-containing protein [Streptomyces sp. NBC_00582]